MLAQKREHEQRLVSYFCFRVLFSRGLSHAWGFLAAQLLHAGNSLLKIPVMDNPRSVNYQFSRHLLNSAKMTTKLPGTDV